MKNEIIAYTKEDFLDSNAPYEEVYRFIQDPFELSREIEKMSELAKAAGVKNFKTLFTNYRKALKKTSGSDCIDRASDFDGQELELNTGMWFADDNGISREGPFGEIFACVHPIQPVQRLVNIDSGVEKLKLAYKKGRAWRSIICDKKQLASANQIIAIADYGVAVTSENAKYLVQYLHDVENLNYDKIPEAHSVTRLGWIGDEGFSPYVDNLIFDGDLSFKHFFESVIQKGKYEKWKEAVKEIRSAGSVPARILLAASFASVLVGPCNCLPFFVHLWGGTETGKTVGLMLAASVWADPSLGKYIHTFNSTAVAQELSAGFVNSLPLMLDELQINKDRKDFDTMIYQLSEGVGRNRGQKTGGLQKTNTWANCIMTTGEQPISNGSSGGGAVNRIIEINCEDTKLFDNPQGLVDVIRKNYGWAGQEFVKALSEEDTMDIAKECQQALYKKLMLHDTTEKQALAASLVLTADAIANDYIFQDGNCLNEKDILPFLSTHDDVSVNFRAYNWLQGWIAENSNKFDESAFSNDIWGKFSQGYIYIIRSVFDKACSENGFNSTSFLSWLKRNGHIQTDKKGFTRAVRINKIVAHCVTFRLEQDENGENYE